MAKATTRKTKYGTHTFKPHKAARKGVKCKHCKGKHTSSQHWSHKVRHGERWYGRRERPQTRAARVGTISSKRQRGGHVTAVSRSAKRGKKHRASSRTPAQIAATKKMIAARKAKR